MRKYLVGIELLGYEAVEVVANSPKEAAEKALLQSDHDDSFQHIVVRTEEL